MGAQQVVKNFPFNLRSVLAVPKGYNPVTLGLCLQAYNILGEIFPGSKEIFRKSGEYCRAELERLLAEQPEECADGSPCEPAD